MQQSFQKNLIFLQLNKKLPSVNKIHVHYRVHSSEPLIPILTGRSLVQILATHFFKIHFNIILQSAPTSSLAVLSFRCSHQNAVSSSRLCHACHMLQLIIHYNTKEHSYYKFNVCHPEVLKHI